jgi:dTDP-4-amino-4,6-dideoxygalactose transaminase
MVIPFNDLSRSIGNDRTQIDVAISRVLNSGHLIEGPENEALAEELSGYLGVEDTILVGNGTDALEIALRSMGVKADDYVITVANAGGYTTSAVRQIGALPLFVDIDPSDLQMAPESLVRVLEASDVKPAAIVVTHLFGAAAPIENLISLAKGFGIPVLEDCAQALGVEVRGRKVGTFGDASTTSFYPTKNLAALGDGGAIFTSDNRIFEKARKLKQYGWASKYHSELRGGQNSRLDEIQAAVLRFRLSKLPSRNERRREIFKSYEAVDNLGGRFPHRDNQSFVPHLAVFVASSRTETMSLLQGEGVEMMIHYPFPDHLQPANSDLKRVSLPETESLSQMLFSLPLFPEMTGSEISAVTEALANLKPPGRPVNEPIARI